MNVRACAFVCRVGDGIITDVCEAKVQEIDLFTTKLTNENGNELLVPNSLLMGGVLTNKNAASKIRVVGARAAPCRCAGERWC